MTAPTVSVVVIFFDDERFLGEAVDSVLAQTYGDWELILADDGSTDASTSIARGYADADPDRIRYLEHPGRVNRGSSATRNLGIASATGSYIAFLDSDDVWEPEKLAEQVAILERDRSVGLVVGATTYWYSWSRLPGRADRRRPVGAPQDTVIDPPQLLSLLYPLGKGTSPSASGFIARRELLDRIGGFEEHLRGLYDDQALFVKAFLETPVYVSSRCWDRYRRHPRSMTHSTSDEEYHAVPTILPRVGRAVCGRQRRR